MSQDGPPSASDDITPAPPDANMRRSTSITLIGTVSGNGIAWLLNFVIAIVFTNETFGIAATVLALASVFTGVSTMRLEVLSQRAETDEEAQLLLRAGWGISIWWGVGLTLAALMAVLLGAPGYWLSLGLLVSLGSLQLIGAASLTRGRRYGRLSVVNFAQAASMGVFQVGLGLLSAGVWSLVSGFLLAKTSWLPVIRHIRPAVHPWRELDRHQRQFATAAGSSALINALSGQIAVLLAGVFYTTAEVGDFAMSVRLLAVPLAVLSQAVAAAAIGEIGSLIRAQAPWYPTVKRTVVALFLIGAVVCGAAGIFGIYIAPHVLRGWDGTGATIAVLALGSWLQFAVSPFSQLLNVTNSHRQLLAWDITRFVLLTASWVVPALLGAPILVCVIAYSAAMTAIYALLFILIRGAARTDQQDD